MKISEHARQRWQQRLCTLDLHEELAGAKPPGKRLRVLLEGPEPAVASKYRQRARYLVSRNGAVFVLTYDRMLILTVYHVKEAKHRARERARWRRIREAASA